MRRFPPSAGARAVVLALGAASVALGCRRETIGLGRQLNDAGSPVVSETRNDAAVSNDAGVPHSPAAPSPTGTHPPAGPSALPPGKLPQRPTYDAGIHFPTDPDRAPAEGDGGNGCRSMADCDFNAPYCQLQTGKCVQCTSDGPCLASGLHCDLAINKCVCDSASDCRWSTGHCDALTRQCLVGCMTALDCERTVFSTICDTTRGVCVGCLTSADCKDRSVAGVPTEICSQGVCVQCAANSDCVDPKHPFCVSKPGVCVDCLRAGDCPDGMQCHTGLCIPAAP